MEIKILLGDGKTWEPVHDRSDIFKRRTTTNTWSDFNLDGGKISHKRSISFVRTRGSWDKV